LTDSFQDQPDNILAEAIRDSDEKAFKALYYRYFDALYRFIWYRLHSAELAQDFVQEIFTRVWNHRSKLDPKKSVKSYLYCIGSNMVIDHFRKRGSEINYSVQNYQKSFVPVDDMDLRISIMDAVNRLPEKLKDVFTLSRFQGLKYSEIADARKISIKTVESRMTQALKLLRKELR
jgi:RNA polymerase sigma-70 factor (ECF subfamily)